MDSSRKSEIYKYINEYQREKYDRITIIRKSGEKERLQKFSDAHGFKSLTEFINTCVDIYMEGQS